MPRNGLEGRRMVVSLRPTTAMTSSFFITSLMPPLPTASTHAQTRALSTALRVHGEEYETFKGQACSDSRDRRPRALRPKSLQNTEPQPRTLPAAPFRSLKRDPFAPRLARRPAQRHSCRLSAALSAAVFQARFRASAPPSLKRGLGRC